MENDLSVKNFKLNIKILNDMREFICYLDYLYKYIRSAKKKKKKKKKKKNLYLII
jgi:hypothetical protein